MGFRPKRKLLNSNSSSFRSRGNKGKHNNKKITVDGIKFDSTFEYEVMNLLKNHPLVKEVEPHPPAIEIIPVTYTTNPKTGRKVMESREVRYNPDFKVTFTNGTEVLIDSKTIATLEDKFLIKIKALEYFYKIKVYILYPQHIKQLDRALLELSKGEFKNAMSKSKLAKLGYF